MLTFTFVQSHFIHKICWTNVSFFIAFSQYHFKNIKSLIFLFKKGFQISKNVIILRCTGQNPHFINAWLNSDAITLCVKPVRQASGTVTYMFFSAISMILFQATKN